MDTSEGIFYFNEDSNYQLKDKKALRSWILQCIADHKLNCGTINYIFCSDVYLHQLNVQYLDHDTLTDVITFDNSQENTVSGDIFISIDRIKENARSFKVNTATELHRVMIHGVLHLCGFKDKSEKDKKAMRSEEDRCLQLLRLS